MLQFLILFHWLKWWDGHSTGSGLSEWPGVILENNGILAIHFSEALGERGELLLQGEFLAYSCNVSN